MVGARCSPGIYMNQGRIELGRAGRGLGSVAREVEPLEQAL